MIGSTSVEDMPLTDNNTHINSNSDNGAETTTFPGRTETDTSPTFNVDDFNVVTEGEASILFPKQENVFYNPIQQFNRDLSVTAIRAWSDLYLKEIKIKNKKRKFDVSKSEPKEESEPTTAKSANINEKPTKQTAATVGTAAQINEEELKYEEKVFKPKINIIEALSATGLRAVRYAKEIPNVGTVVANDLLPAAVENIKRNVEYNNVSKIVKPNLGDANKFIHQQQGKHFQVIDLDPYGTAAPFIDAAVQAVENDGMLLVTCTDLAVLAGNGYPEKCFALYGGTNIKSDATHESALRLVLSMIANSAAKYKKTIEPLLSLSIDFYVRLFVKVKTSPILVKSLASNSMITYLCTGCSSVHGQPLGKMTIKEEDKNKKNPNTKYSWAQGPPVGPMCSFCGAVHHICGPMWAGKLHNKEFIQRILDINEKELSDDIYKTRERIKGMVTLAYHELDGSEAPFYFSPSRVASILKIPCPSISLIVSGIGSCGFNASLTHAHHGCIKTNASWAVIWEVFKKYIEQNKLIKDCEKLNKNTFGYKILTTDILPELEVIFDKNHPSAKKVDDLRKVKIVRFQQNPTKNWGPKARPG